MLKLLYDIKQLALNAKKLVIFVTFNSNLHIQNLIIKKNLLNIIFILSS